MLHIQDVTHDHGGDTLFRGFSFSLDSKSKKRVAVVGRNGAGKSTLLKIIAKQIVPSEWIISTGWEIIWYLEQDPIFPNELKTVGEYLASAFAEEWMFYQAEQALDSVWLDLSLCDQQISSLSGGQKMRLRLVRIMLDNPTILLLDEPTNHLDQEGQDFLAAFISDFGWSVFIVTHDRKLITASVNCILEITQDRTIEAYTGTYREFLSAREARFDRRISIYRHEQAEIAELELWLREHEFHPKFRFSDRVMRQKQTLEKRLKSAIPMPVEDPRISYRIELPQWKWNILAVKELSVGFVSESGDLKTIFENVNFRLSGSDRLRVCWVNGSGKSTLLQAIVSQSGVISGSILIRPETRIGYLSQFSLIDGKKTVIENFRSLSIAGANEERSILARFLFDASAVNTKASNLSYGEQRRLEFAILLSNRPNLLVLDEPTNHLDIFLREQIEDILIDLGVPMLIVSHDEYFIEKLQCTWRIELENGEV